MTFDISNDFFKSGLTDFFVFEKNCTGVDVISDSYDSCKDNSFRGYVLYNVTKDSMTVKQFGLCGLSSENEKRISVGSLRLFLTNRKKIKKEEFKFKTIAIHDCGVELYEFQDKKLLTKKYFSDYMIEENRKYEKYNKELLTYKLLTGLRTELRSINAR
jgi:hypothetical protein